MAVPTAEETFARYKDIIYACRKRPSRAGKLTNPSFLFFSDIHGDCGSTSALSRIIDFANYLAGSSITSVDAVINGGDTVRSKNDTEGTTNLNNYKTQLARCSVDVLTAVGNHDAWTGNWAWVSESDLYAIFGEIISNYSSIYGNAQISRPSGNGCYYYKDYGDVRIVVLNAGEQLNTSTLAVVWNAYWTNAQKTWFTNTLADARANNKHVLIVNHCYFHPAILTPWDFGGNIDVYKKETGDKPWTSDYCTENYASGKNILYEYHLPNDVVSCVKSFMDAGGILVGWLTGHTHFDHFWWIKDESQATYGKQGMFTTANAKADNLSNRTYATDTVRVSGQYSQDLYNYVSVDTTRKTLTIVRIGSNYDWYGRARNILVWDYDNKKILRYR